MKTKLLIVTFVLSAMFLTSCAWFSSDNSEQKQQVNAPSSQGPDGTPKLRGPLKPPSTS